ncbi:MULTISPECIES: AraC family transcriptional regulator [Listeria]|uniref:AraC family transcriptional regulator n=1 Tax=Listeria TaxID=1637 RepID=UPI000B597B1B|nr:MULTISPECIES: AraC family transcriptional regulator [Listeria]
MINSDFLMTLEPMKRLLNVESIVTVYYFEFSKNYLYAGEKHDFWEMVYVDKGELEVSADKEGYELKEGDIIFHKPNEFHNLWANGITAPNVLVVSFVCSSEGMHFFENKIMRLATGERELLAKMLQEAKGVFKPELGRLYLKETRLDHPRIGAEQMLYIYLEQFLIRLIRDETTNVNQKRISIATKKKFEKSIVNDIIQFMNDNLYGHLCLDDICQAFFFSKTYLKTIFKKETGYTVMNFFKMLKMEEAKKCIRENNHTFTQIAQKLGFDSVHYFSNSFKKQTGLSPSEYARSIQALETKLREDGEGR